MPLMSQHIQAPTGKQLAYLRALENQTGTTFVAPSDRRHASREIDRLRKLKRHNGRYVELPTRTDHEPGYATAADPSEITGFGISCRWRTTKPREARQPGASNGSGAPSNNDGADRDGLTASPAG